MPEERLTDEQLQKIDVRHDTAILCTRIPPSARESLRDIPALLSEIAALKQERKQAEDYILHLTDGQAGFGDDPVGFLVASHASIKQERDELSDELSACKESPGGCGYWREAAKLRAGERDEARPQLDSARKIGGHLCKRLQDEFAIEVTKEWEGRVLSGEHDLPLLRISE